MDGLKATLSFDAFAYDYDDEYLTIDTDTHTININNVSRLFGVQYDGNSKLIKFRIRNKLSDIQKMQDSIVYINWIDSRGVKGQSIAIDKTINNDTCEFAWKVPFDALKNSGVLHFAMSAVVTKNSSSVIDQRWSTQIASVITPDGIYIKSYTPSSEEEDRIAQIYTELSNMINKKNDNLQSQVNSLKEDLDKLNEGGLNLKDEVIAGDINKWLDEHPEATTTVQDGAIVEVKIQNDFLKKIENSYVTPEMFGAVGDGIHDDTEAIQNAILTRKPVYINSKTYKITSIKLYKGSILFGNGNESVIYQTPEVTQDALSLASNTEQFVFLKDFTITSKYNGIEFVNKCALNLSNSFTSSDYELKAPYNFIDCGHLVENIFVHDYNGNGFNFGGRGQSVFKKLSAWSVKGIGLIIDTYDSNYSEICVGITGDNGIDISRNSANNIISDSRAWGLDCIIQKKNILDGYVRANEIR